MSEAEILALIEKGKESGLSCMDQVRIANELEYYHNWTIKLEDMLHVRIKDIEEAEHEQRLTLSENL